jgi:hypothetical protein
MDSAGLDWIEAQLAPNVLVGSERNALLTHPSRRVDDAPDFVGRRFDEDLLPEGIPWGQGEQPMFLGIILKKCC